MKKIRILTAESGNPAVFTAEDEKAAEHIAALGDANAVIEFVTSSGSTAYVPVRQITYLTVANVKAPSSASARTAVA